MKLKYKILNKVIKIALNLLFVPYSFDDDKKQIAQTKEIVNNYFDIIAHKIEDKIY